MLRQKIICLEEDSIRRYVLHKKAPTKSVETMCLQNNFFFQVSLYVNLETLLPAKRLLRNLGKSLKPIYKNKNKSPFLNTVTGEMNLKEYFFMK